MIEAKVIEDSINPYTKTRLITLQLKYQRFIHSEFMTHRVFSRNASSSRAIPINKFLRQVYTNPAKPIHWGANNPGMQAKSELMGYKLWFAKFMWNLTAKMVAANVYLVNKISKPHKQVFNRLLEPWQYISVVVTATDWKNFFELRNHEDAQPEIRALAIKMQEAIDNSKPIERTFHLPYVLQQERESLCTSTLMKISTARCARVSYLLHDGTKPDLQKDLQLHDRLVKATPPHLSPTEHVAFASTKEEYFKNFFSWIQYRNIIEQNLLNNSKEQGRVENDIKSNQKKWQS